MMSRCLLLVAVLKRGVVVSVIQYELTSQESSRFVTLSMMVLVLVLVLNQAGPHSSSAEFIEKDSRYVGRTSSDTNRHPTAGDEERVNPYDSFK